MTQPREKNTVSNDTIALLSFDFLKQLATLALAIAGGTLTLIGTSFIQHASRPLLIIATGLLLLSALISLQVQQLLVDRLREAAESPQETAISTFSAKFKLPRTAATENRITVLAFTMFGAGIATAVLAVVGMP